MEASEIREYLHNIDGLRQEIADTNADIEQYKAMTIDTFMINDIASPYPGYVEPDGSQHNKYNSHSRVESIAISRISGIEHLENRCFKLRIILSAINTIMPYLYGRNKTIMDLRYKSHMKWEAIAETLNYSTVHVKRIDRKIVRQIIRRYYIQFKHPEGVPKRKKKSTR
jgi:DNA-directed RNA polymerase specialized sigma subunit